MHFINAGSVGRPKDGDWRAGYCVFEIDGQRIRQEFVRVAYDLKAAQRAIHESELPPFFAEYLEAGGKV